MFGGGAVAVPSLSPYTERWFRGLHRSSSSGEMHTEHGRSVDMCTAANGSASIPESLANKGWSDDEAGCWTYIQIAVNVQLNKKKYDYYGSSSLRLWLQGIMLSNKFT